MGHHVSWVPLCFQCTLDTYLIGLCELPLSVQQCKLTILTINYATFIIGRIFCRTFDESWLKAVQNTCWKKKLLHWIELLCNDVICIKLGNETEKLGPHWTPFFMCMFFNCPSLLYSLTKKCCKQNNSIYDIANAWGGPHHPVSSSCMAMQENRAPRKFSLLNQCYQLWPFDSKNWIA